MSERRIIAILFGLLCCLQHGLAASDGQKSGHHGAGEARTASGADAV